MYQGSYGNQQQGQYPGQYQGNAQPQQGAPGGPPYGAPQQQQQQQQQPYQQQGQYGAPPPAQGPYAPPQQQQQHAYMTQTQIPTQASGSSRYPQTAPGPAPQRPPAYGQAPPTYGAPQGGPPPSSRQAPQGSSAAYSTAYPPGPPQHGGYQQQPGPPPQQYGGAVAAAPQQQQSYGAPGGYGTAPPPQGYAQQAPAGGTSGGGGGVPYGSLPPSQAAPAQQHQMYGGQQSMQGGGVPGGPMPSYGGQQGPPPQQQQYYQQQQQLAPPPAQQGGYSNVAPILTPPLEPVHGQHGYGAGPGLPLPQHAQQQQQHFAPSLGDIPQQAAYQHSRQGPVDERYASHTRQAPLPVASGERGRSQGEGRGDRGGAGGGAYGKTSGKDHRSGGTAGGSRRSQYDERAATGSQQQAYQQQAQQPGGAEKKTRGDRGNRTRGGKNNNNSNKPKAARKSPSPAPEPVSHPIYAVHLPSYQLCATPSMDYVEVSRRYDRLVMPAGFVTAYRHLATVAVPSWAATGGEAGGTPLTNSTAARKEESSLMPTGATVDTKEDIKDASAVVPVHIDTTEGTTGGTTIVQTTSTKHGVGLSRTFNLMGSLPVTHEIAAVKFVDGPLAQYDPDNPAVQGSTPALGSTVYNAKVVLLSGLSEADRAAALVGPGKEGGDHVSRLIKFIVARAARTDDKDKSNVKKSGIFALGGPCDPALDGNPETEGTPALIRTATRHVAASTGVDLSPCTSWTRVLDIRYFRTPKDDATTKGTTPPQSSTTSTSTAAAQEHYEVTALFVVDDAQAALPSLEDWPATWQNRQAKRALDSLPVKEEKEEEEENQVEEEPEDGELPVTAPPPQPVEEHSKSSPPAPSAPRICFIGVHNPKIRLKTMSISLDGLLDYNESDTEEPTFELSMLAEALHEVISRDAGETILEALKSKPWSSGSSRKRKAGGASGAGDGKLTTDGGGDGGGKAEKKAKVEDQGIDKTQGSTAAEAKLEKAADEPTAAAAEVGVGAVVTTGDDAVKPTEEGTAAEATAHGGTTDGTAVGGTEVLLPDKAQEEPEPPTFIATEEGRQPPGQDGEPTAALAGATAIAIAAEADQNGNIGGVADAPKEEEGTESEEAAKGDEGDDVNAGGDEEMPAAADGDTAMAIDSAVEKPDEAEEEQLQNTEDKNTAAAEDATAEATAVVKEEHAADTTTTAPAAAAVVDAKDNEKWTSIVPSNTTKDSGVAPKLGSSPTMPGGLSLDDVMLAFSYFDAGGSGYVLTEDLKVIVESLGLGLHHVTVKELCETAALARGGKADRIDYRRLCTKKN